MSNARKLLVAIVAAALALVVFFIARAMRKSSESGEAVNDRLAKAREAKLAKSILKKSDDEKPENGSTEEL
jgi:hypothetical protein